jgi:hypothetical protein
VDVLLKVQRGGHSDYDATGALGPYDRVLRQSWRRTRDQDMVPFTHQGTEALNALADICG